MKDILCSSVFFGVLISLLAYGAGTWLQKKTRHPLMNPLLISIVLVIAFLLLTGVGYESYIKGASLITYLLTPATICLAVPLYEQVELLKKNAWAVMAGILAGVASSMCCILLFALLFRFDHATYVTFLPKSVTTAIGLGISEELGGYVPVTVVVIVLTGVLGNVFGAQFLRLIRVVEPIAKGIGLGSASHAIGTVRALEMGEVEGAMSGLSIVVSGLVTVVAASLFSLIY